MNPILSLELLKFTFLLIVLLFFFLSAMMPPPDFENIDGWLKKKKYYLDLFKRIGRLGDYTRSMAMWCRKEEKKKSFELTNETTIVAEHMPTLQRLFSAWRLFYMDHFEDMHSVSHYSLDRELDESGRARKVRTTLGGHIYPEIAQLWYFTQRPMFLCQGQEQVDEISLAGTKHRFWITICESFSVAGDDNKPDFQAVELHNQMMAIWKKPIMRYTQTDIMALIMFLTQQLNDIPTSCIREYRFVFDILVARVGVLLTRAWKKNVMDYNEDKDSTMRMSIGKGDLIMWDRNFAIYLSFYMGRIMQRLVYFDHFVTHQMKLPDVRQELITLWGERVKSWVSRIAANTPDEAFLDDFSLHKEGAYSFPGDDDWFKYKWPTEVFKRGIVLDKLRRHLYLRFSSEIRATKDTVMSTIQERFVSRSFMLKMMSNYINYKAGKDAEIKWYDSVVVENSQLCHASHDLQSNNAPLLFQVLSNYWPYDHSQVFICDNVYESIGIWFYLLRTRYEDLLFGRSMLPYSRIVLDGAEHVFVAEHVERASRIRKLVI